MPSHWKGTLLSGHNAGGGLFKDFPVAAQGAMESYVWSTSFLDHIGTTAAAADFANFWTNSIDVAGTATIAQNTAQPVLSLTHGVANQGPSVRWNGTSGRGNTIGSIASGQTVMMECRVVHQTNAAAGPANDAYVGFGTNTAATHILVGATGAPNVAGIADGIGWHWLSANAGRPVPVVWRAGVLETLVGTPTLTADADAIPRFFGVRYEMGTATTPVRCSWYLNRRLVFQHNMTAAFSGRMTWHMGLIANAAASQFNCDRLVLGRLPAGAIPPE